VTSEHSPRPAGVSEQLLERPAAQISPQPPGGQGGWSNTSDYLLSCGRTDDVAVADGTRSYTYAELRSAAAQLVTQLAELGVPLGSRVGVVGANSFFWIAAYLAAMKGHVAVPLSDKASPDQIAEQAAWVGCAAVFADRRDQRRFSPAMAKLPVITEESLDLTRPADWPESDEVDPDADAALMFTSGTTSGPKAVRITHRNIQANTASIISYLGLRADDRILVVLPFFYCFGASLLHTHLRAGGAVVLCDQFVFPELVLDLIERERCTAFAGVPSTFQLLLRASSFQARELPSLRMIQQAGGRLPSQLVQELLATKPGLQLFVMYGQTEATARLSYLPPQRLADKLGSIGRGIPGVQLRVVDESGNPVAVGETGEIVAFGENISPGYYEDPVETAGKFRGGALWTGDLAVVDPDGFIFIVDRKSDFIKSWGHRVSSLDVESCALRLADLESAAAVGLPDPEAGEAVTLFITLRPQATVTAEEVLAHLRRHLAKHMVPRAVHVVESMPLTASGKIAKARLRDDAVAVAARSVV
jgi:long-chain acyl-CoA synthetase